MSTIARPVMVLGMAALVGVQSGSARGNALQDAIGTEPVVRQAKARKPLELTISPKNRRGHNDSFLGKTPSTAFVSFRRDGSVLDWRGTFPRIGLPSDAVYSHTAATFSREASPTFQGSAGGLVAVTATVEVTARFGTGSTIVSGSISLAGHDGASASQSGPPATSAPPHGTYSFEASRASGSKPSTGSFEGSFYGVDANQTAGTFSFGSSPPQAGIDNFDGVGAFGAAR